MGYLQNSENIDSSRESSPQQHRNPIAKSKPELIVVSSNDAAQNLSAANLPLRPQLSLFDQNINDQALDASAIAIHQLVQRALRNDEVRSRVLSHFDEAQARDLYLQNLDTSERFYLSASITPIVLPEIQEIRLREMAEVITTVKLAIVESATHNQDLFEFLLQGVDPIGREIMSANMGRLPDHLRTRFDTYTSLISINPLAPAVLELNGGEPRSDLGSSRMNEIVIGMLYNYLCIQADKLKNAGLAAPSALEIIQCFPATLLPIERVIERICLVYSQQRAKFPTLPKKFNVGLLVFENPDNDAPLCPISSHEARRSSAYYEAYENVQRAVGFNPFDIVDFESVAEGEAGAVVPLVLDEKGKVVRIDFIRRLHGEPMENLEVWEKLRRERPQIYYPFTGVSHPEFNPPEARRFIPLWRWMNPLNSLMTCKRLDAILTDVNLQERFCVKEELYNYFVSRDPKIEVTECLDRVDAALILSGYYTPKTSALVSSKSEGLYPGNNDLRGTLTIAQIDHIRRNRNDYVVKIDPWGFGGNGVVVGKNLELTELPSDIVERFQARIDRGDFDLEIASNFDTLELFWSHLIDVVLERGGSIVQNYVSPQPYPVTRLVTISGKSSIELQQFWDTDVCVSCIGVEMQNILGRASQSGRANVTGNPAATRVTSITREVATRILNLIEKYKIDLS